MNSDLNLEEIWNIQKGKKLAHILKSQEKQRIEDDPEDISKLVMERETQWWLSEMIPVTVDVIGSSSNYKIK